MSRPYITAVNHIRPIHPSFSEQNTEIENYFFVFFVSSWLCVKFLCAFAFSFSEQSYRDIR